MTDRHTGNGIQWLSGMTQILVAGLLVAAAGGAIWSAIEVRSLSVKIESMDERIDRHEVRINRIQKR